MSYSKLANEGFQSCRHHSSGRSGQKICKITPHYWANDGNGASNSSIVNMWNSSRQASSNYLIDDRGNILCAVQEEDRAWTSSSPANDNQAITIEVSTTSNATGAITDKAWQSLVRLCTDVCHRYNFRLNWTGNASGSLTIHKWFASTDCPGAWLESHMPELARTVNNNLDTGNFEYSGVASDGGTSASGFSGTIVISDPAIAYAAGIEGKILFDQEEVYPFVISVDAKTKNLDYDKLKEYDVIGICIDMGSYYTESHTVNEIFRSTKLEKQYESAKEAGLTVGLSTHIRGRTEEEVLQELYEIRLTVLKYPPDMGLWLIPTFYSKDKKKNDKLIQIYYKALIKLGFIDQVGFYCKKDEMEKFNWEDVCEEWYWWMDRHLKTVDKIHNLPLPKFFFYDDPGDEDALIEPDFEGWAALKAQGGSMFGITGVGGYTDYQKAVSDAAQSGKGCCTTSGLCAQFVTDVFTQARKVKSDIKAPYGNAVDYWTKWKSSGGSDKNPPVGSVVVGSGWPYGGSATHNPYGHVGVVLIGGKVADNVGRHRISDSLDAWLSGQNAICNGHQGYFGWVWANGQDLSKLGTMIGGTVGGGSKVTTIDGVTMKLPVDWGYAHRHQSNYDGANWTGPDNVRGIGIFNCNEEGDGSSAYANSYALNVRWEYVRYTNSPGKWPAHARYSGKSATTGIDVGGVSDGIASILYRDGVNIGAYTSALGKARILVTNPETGKSCVCASGFYAMGRSEHNWGGNPLALLGGITTAISNAIGAKQNQSVLELSWVDPNTKLGPV